VTYEVMNILQDVAWLPSWLQSLGTNGSIEFVKESQAASYQEAKVGISLSEFILFFFLSYFTFCVGTVQWREEDRVARWRIKPLLCFQVLLAFDITVLFSFVLPRLGGVYSFYSSTLYR